MFVNLIAFSIYHHSKDCTHHHTDYYYFTIISIRTMQSTNSQNEIDENNKQSTWTLFSARVCVCFQPILFCTRFQLMNNFLSKSIYLQMKWNEMKLEDSTKKMEFREKKESSNSMRTLCVWRGYSGFRHSRFFRPFHWKRFRVQVLDFKFSMGKNRIQREHSHSQTLNFLNMRMNFETRLKTN